MLELLNRAGADGWELADREERHVHGEGDHYGDASWTRTIYTFKFLLPE